MKTTNAALVLCISVILASASVVACEAHERVVTREPVRERVVVTAPPPPVVQERVVVHP